MADGNFEKYAAWLGAVVIAILILMFLMYWWKNYTQKSVLIPAAPNIIMKAPSLVQQPFFGLFDGRKPPHKKHDGTTTVQPDANTFVYNSPGHVNKYGKNPVDNELPSKKSKHHKGRRHSSDSSSSSSCSDDNQKIIIEANAWLSKDCAHSRNFWHVWNNVEKRLKKLCDHDSNVKLVFKNKKCDSRDKVEFQQTLVNGAHMRQYPTVSICVKGQPQQLITESAINEEELENRMYNFIMSKKREMGYNN